MADSLNQRDGVVETAGSNPELKDWTFALYTHLLDHPEQDILECEIDRVGYDISIGSLDAKGTQFVSITRQDEEGDELFFFVNDDKVAPNTFSKPENKGLPFLKDICKQLGVSVKNSQSVQKGVAGRTGFIAGCRSNTINFF